MTIEECLKILGQRTPSEIRDLLIKEGIKGFRNRCIGCPVAVYLKWKTNKEVSVFPSHVTIHYEDFYNMPLTVTNFINNFDVGLYPELEEEKTK